MIGAWRLTKRRCRAPWAAALHRYIEKIQQIGFQMEKIIQRTRLNTLYTDILSRTDLERQGQFLDPSISIVGNFPRLNLSQLLPPCAQNIIC